MNKNKDIAKEFVSKYGYIFFDYGQEVFLNFLQLETLKKMDNDFSLNINVEEVMRIVYNYFIKNQHKEIYDELELETREYLIEDARKCIRRLDNEELRDIIFHHPLRDVIDENMNDEEITNENLIKYKYNSKLAKKIIKQENETRKIAKKETIDKIKKILNEYNCTYSIIKVKDNNNNDEINITYNI